MGFLRLLVEARGGGEYNQPVGRRATAFTPAAQRVGRNRNTRSTVLVTVSARHGHLNEVTQKLFHEKAEKLLHYFDRLTSIVVTVDLHRDRDNKLGVEIIAHAEHKHEFVATDRDVEIEVAFQLAKDHIKQQLRHYKEKLQDHRRDPSHNGGVS